jgi:hypothetical protein
MKLELKHLAPYLPYQLNCMAQGEDKQSFEFQGVSDVTWIDLHEIGRTVCEQYNIEDVFPILRPLSDFEGAIIRDIRIDLELSHNQVVEFLNFMAGAINLKNITYSLFLSLCEKHIDVFGLIEKGLAIDINTLKK